MLVLARRPEEKILFPDLAITIQVLGIHGNLVRLGITAPTEIAILRHEVAERRGVVPKVPPLSTQRLLNRLHSASLATQVLQQQLECGMTADANRTLHTLFDELQNLSREVEGPQTPPPALPASRRALLVEDDDNERELLASFLRLSGFVVDTASDGLVALETLERERPDVVLLDMLMPRCDGPTTVAAIRNSPALHDLKVFAVSGSPASCFNIPVGPGGVDRWFAKPLDPSTLVQELLR